MAGPPFLDAAGPVKEDAVSRVPLASEDWRYGDLDGARLKAFLMAVDAISLKVRDSGPPRLG